MPVVRPTSSTTSPEPCSSPRTRSTTAASKVWPCAVERAASSRRPRNSPSASCSSFWNCCACRFCSSIRPVSSRFMRASAELSESSVNSACIFSCASFTRRTSRLSAESSLSRENSDITSRKCACSASAAVPCFSASSRTMRLSAPFALSSENSDSSVDECCAVADEIASRTERTKALCSSGVRMRRSSLSGPTWLAMKFSNDCCASEKRCFSSISSSPSCPTSWLTRCGKRPLDGSK